jgi:hypothetical protein
MSRQDTSIPMLLLHPAYRLWARHSFPCLRPKRPTPIGNPIPLVLEQVVNQHSLSTGSEAIHPNVTYIDNKTVILAVRILVGKVLDMGILLCSDTCLPQDQKQTKQTYAG